MTRIDIYLQDLIDKVDYARSTLALQKIFYDIDMQKKNNF